MITQVFRTNRARFPRADLAAHQGEWIAFSADGTRIIAGAATLEALETKLEGLGVDGQDVVFESVGGPDDDIYLGAGELM